MTEQPPHGLDVFSALYAVVLDTEWFGGRVRWSPTQHGWLPSREMSRYLPRDKRWQGSVIEDAHDGPSEEDRGAALELALAVTRTGSDWRCPRCHRRNPGGHFIAPNVFGVPEVYCVQVPAYDVVDSGGQGLLKHWGSPFGCHAVHMSLDSGPGPYIGPRAAFLYGQPLPADEVIDRDWCTRCANKAGNSREGHATERVKDDVKRDVRRLSKELRDYYGED